MNVEMWSIERVKPYDRNPRQNDGGVEAVARSLREFGFRQPLVVDEAGVVVVGHTRLKAAQSLGMAEVPVHVAAGLTPEQARAYRIADNQTSNLSAWDYEKLRLEAVDLEALGVDLDLLGFGDAELAEIMAKPAGELGDPEEIPEPPKEPTTRPGDLWKLGKHRLLCGDSTVATDVDRLMGGEKAQLCMTDPPYGAAIQYDTHDDTQDALSGLIAGFFPLAEGHADMIALTPGINNMWHYRRPDWVLCWFYAAGTGRTPWGFSAWQPVLVWGKDPKLANGEGAHPDGYNWPMSKHDAEERKTLNHACPKPVSSWAKWIERLSNDKTDLLYDPFLGSGTTLIACEQLNRRCFGMEISPAYCDVIVARWEKFTGGKAELEARDG